MTAHDTPLQREIWMRFKTVNLITPLGSPTLLNIQLLWRQNLKQVILCSEYRIRILQRILHLLFSWDERPESSLIYFPRMLHSPLAIVRVGWVAVFLCKGLCRYPDHNRWQYTDSVLGTSIPRHRRSDGSNTKKATGRSIYVNGDIGFILFAHVDPSLPLC
jgi:hypothetical protein